MDYIRNSMDGLVELQDSRASRTQPPQDPPDLFLKTPVFVTSEDRHGSVEKSENGSLSPTANTWVTTFLRFGPLSGLFALFIAFISIFASLTVLVASAGSPTALWAVQPSVYLGVITAIGNQATRYAALQGATISWWVGALNVSSLSGLHRRWESATSPLRAILHGRRITLVGLACLLSALISVDGPLLQRASAVITTPIVGESVEITTLIAPEVPTGFTGQWAFTPYDIDVEIGRYAPASNGTTSARISTGLSGRFTHVQSQFVDNAPLAGFIKGCNGTCRAKIRAPALLTEACRNWVIPVDFYQPVNRSMARSQSDWPQLHGQSPIDRYSFLNYLNFIPNATEKLDLITGYTGVQACKGVFNLTACSLVSAIGEYDVSISNNVATLENPGSPLIISRANNTAIADTKNETQSMYHSTLAGFAAMYASLYESYMVYVDPIDGTPNYYEGGPTANWQVPSIHDVCTAFGNPQDNLMGRLNQFMFRIGVFAAQNYNASELEPLLDRGLSINSTVVGTVTGSHAVYHSTYGYFIAAALVDVVSLGLLLSTFWGWWRLGREVSFSPLEIAKAFDAPLLRDCHSNSSGAELSRARGETQICYGVRRAEDTSRKGTLAFAELFLVSQPKSHTTFDS